MTDSIVLEDSSRLSRADVALHRLERWLNLSAGIIVLFVVLFSVINIAGRGLFNRPFNAYFDLMGQSVPLIAFLGLAYCQRLGGHIRMDLVISKLKGRPLWVFEWLTTLLTFAVIAVLGWGAWLHTERAIRIGDSTEDVGLPVWPVKGLLVVMFALLAVRLLLQSWGYWRLIRSGDDRPIAVPAIEDAAEQAEREARSTGVFDADTGVLPAGEPR